ARDAGKIARDFELPKAARNNTPEAIARALKPAADAGLLPLFPFGTDFTDVEQRLIPALSLLQLAAPMQLVRLLMSGWSAKANAACLERLGLAKPASLKERFYAALVRGALASAAR